MDSERRPKRVGELLSAGAMRPSLSDRIARWRVFCRRCSFTMHVQARRDQMEDQIDLTCPTCKQVGLDSIEDPS